MTSLKELNPFFQLGNIDLLASIEIIDLKRLASSLFLANQLFKFLITVRQNQRLFVILFPHSETL
jgi:hypothetical protein